MKNNKRGSSSIFLVMIMATMFTLVFTLFMGARSEYIKSKTDAILSLAGDSVMSEFNDYVQKEYGLFVLEGKKSQITQKLHSYVDYSLGEMNDVSVKSLTCSGANYSTADIKNIQKQILEYMKYAQSLALITDMLKSADIKNDMKYETLRNGETIVSLPTYNMPQTSLTALVSSRAENPESFKEVFEAGTDGYLINQYILSHFNNRAYKVDDNHFFKNEVEYVLGGELSDKVNENRVKMAIEAIRFPMNLQHIYTNPQKMEALLAIAEVLTPEAAPLTQATFAIAWAYAETDNDVKLLWDGHKVPLVKNNQSWAVDLDGVVDGVKSGTFKPEIEKGLDYSEYLQCVLFFQDSDVKTARIMDLIQINTRMNSDRYFAMTEHCVGIHIAAQINNKKFNYEKKY